MPNNPRDKTDGDGWFALVKYAVFANFIGAALSNKPGLLRGGFMAFLLSQLGLLAIWSVFGTGRWFLRWLAMTMLAQLLIVASLAPWVISSQNAVCIQEILFFVLMAPCFLLAAQLPLYAVKVFRGYRIVPARAPLVDSAMRRGQFGISDMLGATTLLAVVLALSETARTTGVEHLARVFWGLALVSCMMLIISSTLILLPCLWAVMRARQQGCATMIVGALIIVSLSPMINPSSRNLWQGLIEQVVLSGIPVATLLGGLRLMRAAGFVMIRPGESLLTIANQSTPPQVEEETRGRDTVHWPFTVSFLVRLVMRHFGKTSDDK